MNTSLAFSLLLINYFELLFYTLRLLINSVSLLLQEIFFAFVALWEIESGANEGVGCGARGIRGAAADHRRGEQNVEDGDGRTEGETSSWAGEGAHESAKDRRREGGRAGGHSQEVRERGREETHVETRNHVHVLGLYLLRTRLELRLFRLLPTPLSACWDYVLRCWRFWRVSLRKRLDCAHGNEEGARLVTNLYHDSITFRRTK